MATSPLQSIHEFLWNLLGRRTVPTEGAGLSLDPRILEQQLQDARRGVYTTSEPITPRYRSLTPVVPIIEPAKTLEGVKRYESAKALEDSAKKRGAPSAWHLIRIAWLKSLLAPLVESKFFDQPLIIQEVGNLRGTAEGAEFLTLLAQRAGAGAALGSKIPGIGNVVGAAAGAVVATIEWIVGAISRAQEIEKAQAYSAAMLARLIPEIGPPPASLVIQLASECSGKRPIGKLYFLYLEAMTLFEQYPVAFKNIPALTASGMQQVIETATTELQRSSGYNPLWAEGLFRALKNTDAADVDKVSLRTWSVDKENRLSFLAASTYIVNYHMDRLWPELADLAAAKKGWLSQGELESFRMRGGFNVDTNGQAWVYINNTVGAYNGRDGQVLTVNPEIGAFGYLRVDLSSNSGLLFGPNGKGAA